MGVSDWSTVRSCTLPSVGGARGVLERQVQIDSRIPLVYTITTASPRGLEKWC